MNIDTKEQFNMSVLSLWDSLQAAVIVIVTSAFFGCNTYVIF